MSLPLQLQEAPIDDIDHILLLCVRYYTQLAVVVVGGGGGGGYGSCTSLQRQVEAPSRLYSCALLSSV